MTRPVYIAASGLFCARGDSPRVVADALWAGNYAADTRQFGKREFPYFGLPFNAASWMTRAQKAVSCVTGQLGSISPETPLFVASSSFQIGHFEQLDPPFELPLANAEFSRDLADWMQLSGPRVSVSNACISGFSAIDMARSLIAAGQIDDAIVIGIELANDITLAGFAAMELLSPTACRPFDARRDGLVLGEAVAAIHLSATPGCWRIAGLHTGIDAYSMTGPDPEGGPIASVMAACLQEAAMTPADIELIKLQAAGSPGTDIAEANALRRVFTQTMPPLLSLKSALGHTLGASGVAELAALLACLEANQIPATAGFANPDPEIALFPTVDRSTARISRAMLNLVGFGGGLATMIVERQ
ncbi:MAG: beta-ketoacyl synthase N-terminal-like domain-containing protein [Azonexus sp.]|nr:beta-ketoacyl synthase N-terminal-like domain-containing protein [Azonexus sp.]